MTADKRQYLKAAEGRTVRRPQDGEPWPEAGDFADDSLFIRRRLADGDLVKAEVPPPEPEPEEAGDPAQETVVDPPGTDSSRKPKASKSAGDGEK